MSQADRRRDRRPERGQSLVMITVFMMSLLGACALAIDVGAWYQAKRSVQASADAAALAGASRLPVSQAAAKTAAASEYANNGLNTDTVTYTITTNATANDSVKVTASRQRSTWFTRLFGKNTVTITATSTATIQSFTRIVPQQNVMPWGVLQGQYTPGAQFPIYTKDTANANNGALSPQYVNGQLCSAANGASDYKNEISGAENVCPLTVGDQVPTKPGNNSGPTSQGLTSRISTWKTFNQIVQLNADGTYQILDASSPQLVLIPVVVNLDGNPYWPNGSSANMKVVGFAWFVILSCGTPPNTSQCSSSDGKQVNGEFVGLDTPDTSYTTGAWTGSAADAYTVALTG
jgi:Flp pilus assembly protein TadG